jgi:hypothetical protein
VGGDGVLSGVEFRDLADGGVVLDEVPEKADFNPQFLGTYPDIAQTYITIRGVNGIAVYRITGWDQEKWMLVGTLYEHNERRYNYDR